MTRRIPILLLTLCLLLVLFTVASAQDQPERPAGQDLPANLEGLKLSSPVEVSSVEPAVLHNSLYGAKGSERVIVRLKDPAVSEQDLVLMDAPQAKAMVESEQANFLDQILILDPNARVLGQTQIVLNAVFIAIDASVLPALANHPAVLHINPVGDYELDLSETVPYTGAADVQDTGVDGSGVKVAVLDSGIDYYHAALGGSGDPADYAADDPTIIEPGTFPTAKVVGGYDFVGSLWEGSDGPVEEPDPDPLDDGPGAGHGTHVAHIIGGSGGVAPGVDLYAVKVCSSVSSACSGIALIQAMEFAVDPNGDGKTKDHLDIVNMSLGSLYGQPFDDDLSQALNNATTLGVLSVAAAGNGADKPYVQDTPASAETAFAVAQTQVPSAALQLLNVDGVDYPAVFQPWSAPLQAVIGPVQTLFGGDFGSNTGCSTDPDGESELPADRPYPPGTFSGNIVLVDRGGCSFTAKIRNIEFGGGAAGIIGLVAPGTPFSGGFGGGTEPAIPGYMISQADSNAIKAAIGGGGGSGTLDPANQLPLVGQMVGSSSRGPQHESTTLIKPEIGAPGASVSAIAGTGSGEGPFSGTSGATPMIAGSAALLLDGFDAGKDDDDDDDDDDEDRDDRARTLNPLEKAASMIDSALNSISPTRQNKAVVTSKNDDDDDDEDEDEDDDKDKRSLLDPLEIKALLMNNGETDIDTDPFTGLAPITRIGGGEVRVNQAMGARVAAWDDDVYQGALSFGFVDVADGKVTLKKKVRVRNYSNDDINLRITPTFRFDDDVANDAVTVEVRSKVEVDKGEDATFWVEITIDGSKLRGNYMNSGSMGADPSGLTTNEYDGYLILDDGKHPIHLPWHVLPRQAANVKPVIDTFQSRSTTMIDLENIGEGMAQNDAYSLLAISPNQPEGGPGETSPTPDLRAVGVNTFIVPPEFCSSEFLWAFAINTWERQEHLVPVIHNVYLDTDQDGMDDYVVFNFDLSLSGSISDGRQVTWALNLSTGGASALFFAEHSMNTGNTVLLVCGEQVGLTRADMFVTNVDVTVETEDWYNGGPGDLIEGLTVTPLGEQYVGAPSADIPGNSSGFLEITDWGYFPGNSPELGVMMFTNGDRGSGARGGATQATEALLFFAE